MSPSDHAVIVASAPAAINLMEILTAAMETLHVTGLAEAGKAAIMPTPAVAATE
ncbi:MAG: hypothetical protein QNL16_10870 [Rhodobacterales bacterium]|jgi:hypothetical protein|nr:hypothetical protein [Pseudomonadota bacterium]MDA1285253.1 hypothetical protein [Pseudomonadota bacterium]NQW13262.1 hypothetical protein [Rhodobacter sp.]